MPNAKPLSVCNLSKRGKVALRESVHASYECEIPGADGWSEECSTLTRINVFMWVKVNYTDWRYTAKDRVLLTRLVGPPQPDGDGYVDDSPAPVWNPKDRTLDGLMVAEYEATARHCVGVAQFVHGVLSDREEFFSDMDSLSQDHCHMAEMMLSDEFEEFVELPMRGLAMMRARVDEEFRGIDLGLHAITLFMLTWGRLSPGTFVMCYPSSLLPDEGLDEFDRAAIRFKLMQHWERAGFVPFKDGYMVADLAYLTVMGKAFELGLVESYRRDY